MYDCYFDQNNKLVSIYATSKALVTRSEVEDFRDQFERLKSALEDKYGKVLYVTGSRRSSVKWMDCVGYQHSFTEALWDGSSEYSRSSHIDKIVLDVVAVDKDHGFIKLEYLFNTGIEGPL